MQSAVNGDASPSKARSAAGRTSHRAAHQLIRLNLIQRIFGGGVLLPLFFLHYGVCSVYVLCAYAFKSKYRSALSQSIFLRSPSLKSRALNRRISSAGSHMG